MGDSRRLRTASWFRQIERVFYIAIALAPAAAVPAGRRPPRSSLASRTSDIVTSSREFLYRRKAYPRIEDSEHAGTGVSGMTARAGNRTRTSVHAVDDGTTHRRADYLATEEPLEMRLVAGGETRTIGVTMRTPGADFELAAGFLYGEGIVSRADDIRRMSYCIDRDVDAEQRFNIVNVELAASTLPDIRALERHFYTSSACGVCGKATLESLHVRGCPVLPDGPEVARDTVLRLPDALREAQGVFASTGGLHACGIFTTDGEPVCVREDVGRHNAVDKAVGWALTAGRLPLNDAVLMVSGRSSYEIVQKALAAGAPVVCAVSAPSSLAVDLAREFNMTLVGFLRGSRFNVYSGAERILEAAPASL